jgi:ankyrin repeat protein
MMDWSRLDRLFRRQADVGPEMPDIPWVEAADNPWGVRLLDVRSSEGATPLMVAVQRSNPEKVRFLIDRGADLDAHDHRGFTALHRAAEAGFVDLVRVLLDRGASPNPDADGQTPRSLALERGQKEAVALLDRYSGHSL